MTAMAIMLRDFLRSNWLALLVLAALFGGWFLLRTPATALASVEEFDRRIRGGRPVVVEFFSNT